jgi:hypothetical protein
VFAPDNAETISVKLGIVCLRHRLATVDATESEAGANGPVGLGQVLRPRGSVYLDDEALIRLLHDAAERAACVGLPTAPRSSTNIGHGVVSSGQAVHLNLPFS